MNDEFAKAIKATRESDNGFTTCRVCQAKYTQPETITVYYGNGLLYSICPSCINAGLMVIVARTSKGIEIKAVQQRPADIRSQ